MVRIVPSPPSTTARSVSPAGSAPSTAPSRSVRPCFSTSCAGTRTSTPASTARSITRSRAAAVCAGLRRVKTVIEPRWLHGSAFRAAASKSCVAPSRPASASHTKLSRLPAGPGRPDGGVARARLRPSSSTAKRPTATQRGAARVGRPDDSPSTHLVAAGLELRLDQGEAVEARRGAADHRREDLGERDEGHVDHDQVRLEWQLAGLERARVGALDHGHPRILAQPPVKLRRRPRPAPRPPRRRAAAGNR